MFLPRFNMAGWINIMLITLTAALMIKNLSFYLPLFRSDLCDETGGLTGD